MPSKSKNLIPEYEPVTFSEEHGIRFLHFGTCWVQGAMRLDAPDSIELEYAQQMMAGLIFLDPDDHHTNKFTPFQFTQLGLGTGALTKFAYKNFPKSKVTAVELNPGVIVASKVMFSLPSPDKRLKLVQLDALEFVLDSVNHNSTNLLQVDLYDATARGPVLSSREFYQGCFDTMKSPGIMTVNLFSKHKSFKTNINNICDVFGDRVLLFPEVHDCNVVAIAFKGPSLSVDWDQIKKRCQSIESEYQLPARTWAQALHQANVRQEHYLSI